MLDTAQHSLGYEVLAKIIDGSSIPSFVINRDHKVICWNTAMETLTGIKKQDIIGTDEQWRAFYVKKRPVLADLIMDGISRNRRILEAHYTGRYKKSDLIDGAYEVEDFFPELGKHGKWLHFTASPIRDQEGKTTEAIETLEDITQRKRTEEALHESERNFRALFEDACDAIWVHNMKGAIRTANRATGDLSGYTLDELLRMNIKSLISRESLAVARDIGKKLLQDQRIAMPYEIKMIRHDGSEAICNVSTNLFVRDGQPLGFQNIARDVTQEKRMQAKLRYYLEEITRAQEEERKRVARELHDDTAQLLGSLSRQLDNFIRESHSLTAQDVSLLQGLRSQVNLGVQDIHRFIQDLLPPILDVLGFVPAVRSLMNDLQKSDGITAELKVLGTEKRGSPEVELLLFRVVQEGLNNIIKHAQASQATVTIEFIEPRVRVTISDNGRGFELLRLYDTPRSRKLGLTGMQERTQLMGGTFQVKSAPGKGTTLTVEALF
jgi:two-component system, NarL family, sensor histidine kinase DegS